MGIVNDLRVSGSQRFSGHGGPAEIGVVLGAAVAAHHAAFGNIGAATGNGVAPQTGVPIHIGVTRCNGVIEDPCAVSRLRGQIALAFHEATYVACVDLAADIPQRTDAVQERIFLMGHVCDLIFLIADGSHLLFFFYAAFWHRASSFRNAASMSEKRSVRLNFSDTFPGIACSSSIFAHSSGWWS